MSLPRSPAARALACLDLTNLDDACTTEDVQRLCARAQSRHGPVAAVCVWPRFVADARAALGATGIRVATVVAFPGGDDLAGDVRDMTERAIADGAHEIDMVIPYKAMIEGHPEQVPPRVARVVEAAAGAPVKAILETGVLGDGDWIRRAARLAIEGGADFLKTSTGKVGLNATPEAARILLEEIAAADRIVGLKVSGGVRSTDDAALYLDLCDEIMGPDWACPAVFRFGASSVLDALLESLDGSGADGAGVDGAGGARGADGRADGRAAGGSDY